MLNELAIEVNWNITLGGAIAMGAHRSSLREDSQVSAAALAMDIINGKGRLFASRYPYC